MYETAGRPVRMKGDYVRDEAGQAAYLRALLEIFDADGVDGAFAYLYLFVLDGLPHRPRNPRHDLDLVDGFGVVVVSEDRNGGTSRTCGRNPRSASLCRPDRLPPLPRLTGLARRL